MVLGKCNRVFVKFTTNALSSVTQNCTEDKKVACLWTECADNVRVRINRGLDHSTLPWVQLLLDREALSVPVLQKIECMVANQLGLTELDDEEINSTGMDRNEGKKRKRPECDKTHTRDAKPCDK